MGNVRPTTNRGAQKPQTKQAQKPKAVQQQEAPQQTWNSITGVCRVFGQQFENQDNISYSISVSHKEADGSYINSFINVRFAKSCGEPSCLDASYINIHSGFLTAGKNNRIVLVITEWEWEEME